MKLTNISHALRFLLKFPLSRGRRRVKKGGQDPPISGVIEGRVGAFFIR